MSSLTVSEAREDFGRTVDRVHHRHERVCITKHGRPVVALVPVEDLELLTLIEDRFDIEAARDALAEGGRVSYDVVRKEMGLS